MGFKVYAMALWCIIVVPMTEAGLVRTMFAAGALAATVLTGACDRPVSSRQIQQQPASMMPPAAERFSRAFESVRLGVTRAPDVSDLERIILLMDTGMSPAAVAEHVFPGELAWQSAVSGAVWGEDDWSAAVLEYPNPAHPVAPGRAVAGETATAQWIGSSPHDLQVWPRAEDAPDPQGYALARARKGHWAMARDPDGSFSGLMAIAAPLHPALPPKWFAVPDPVAAALDAGALQEVEFAGTRGLRGQALSAQTRSSPQRKLWACWWGAPGNPYYHGLFGWSTEVEWPLGSRATPENIESLYGM